MNTTIGIVSILAFLPLATLAPAQDWPQFFGPERNGVYSGPALSDDWGTDGPPVLWSIPVGLGLSGPVVVGDRVILHHRVGNEEVVDALDRETGEQIWRYAYPTTYRDDFGFDEGPRAIPVVAGGIVYTFGAQGQLHAVNLESGARIWSVDTMREFSVPKNFFGAGGSPLVEDGRVIANIGGMRANGDPAGIVAFDAETGDVLWTGVNDESSYSSPVGATFDGERYAVLFTRTGLVGIRPEDGQLKFQLRWRSRSASSVNAASPVIVGNRIFISAEYGPGAAVLEWDGARLTPLWTSNDVLSTHYATSVYSEGTLYGYHGRQEFGPSLRAVDFQTGEVYWDIDQFRAGSIQLADDTLVILREGGELVLADASPEEFRVRARATILPPTVRAYPALSDGVLFVRNSDRRDGALTAFDLRPGN
jgi:outer membrane protein assembly factor BamB